MVYEQWLGLRLCPCSVQLQCVLLSGIPHEEVKGSGSTLATQRTWPSEGLVPYPQTHSLLRTPGYVQQPSVLDGHASGHC
jgi:hypothetical protein